MATQAGALFRADEFCRKHKLPEIVAMVNDLRQHVQAEVFSSIAKQMDGHYKPLSLEWYGGMLRFLSRVTADDVWAKAAETHTWERPGKKPLLPMVGGGAE